ncbi:hypothetical protein ACFSTD_18430 [Novosphingobium colocasiae]
MEGFASKLCVNTPGAIDGFAIEKQGHIGVMLLFAKLGEFFSSIFF